MILPDFDPLKPNGTRIEPEHSKYNETPPESESSKDNETRLESEPSKDNGTPPESEPCKDNGPRLETEQPSETKLSDSESPERKRKIGLANLFWKENK